MLDLLYKWTWALSNYDLAIVNFFFGWIAALGTIALMVMVGEKRTLKTVIGFLRWAQTCALFWLTAALAINASYPVYYNSQPWLPSVILTATVMLAIWTGVMLRAATSGKQANRAA